MASAVVSKTCLGKGALVERVYVGNEGQWNVVSDDEEDYDDTSQEEDCTMGSPTGESEP